MGDIKTEYDKLFIGGKWTEPSTSEVIEVHCPATGEYVGKVPLAAIKVLRLMASGDIATYRRLKLEPILIDAIEGVLTAQLEHHLDRRLKSLQFLHQMRISN